MATTLSVAPLVGAWIETVGVIQNGIARVSHPSWVRGLKLRNLITLNKRDLSHPSWVRGLKRKKGFAAYRRVGRTPRGCVD